MAWLVTLNAQKIAQTVSDQLSSLLTVANYGAAIVTKSAANFGVSDFETMFAAVATPGRAIVLDSPYFVKVKPQSWLPPGFSNVLEHSRWASADPNVRGFVGDPAAIVISYSAPDAICAAQAQCRLRKHLRFAADWIGRHGVVLLSAELAPDDGLHFAFHGRNTGRSERLEVAHERMISCTSADWCLLSPVWLAPSRALFSSGDFRPPVASRLLFCPEHGLSGQPAFFS